MCILLVSLSFPFLFWFWFWFWFCIPPRLFLIASAWRVFSLAYLDESLWHWIDGWMVVDLSRKGSIRWDEIGLQLFALYIIFH
ncbi:hypothetical protein DL95DRAFT_381172 [Leptodontidium sp. 2 PMI_412]|nr:hypothetical protein DL95DRAFT_381172 [Leptodontidium sp. 2 PMI_412]